jgi:hypothetical protein
MNIKTQTYAGVVNSVGSVANPMLLTAWFLKVDNKFNAQKSVSNCFYPMTSKVRSFKENITPNNLVV